MAERIFLICSASSSKAVLCFSRYCASHNKINFNQCMLSFASRRAILSFIFHLQYLSYLKLLYLAPPEPLALISCLMYLLLIMSYFTCLQKSLTVSANLQNLPSNARDITLAGEMN